MRERREKKYFYASSIAFYATTSHLRFLSQITQLFCFIPSLPFDALFKSTKIIFLYKTKRKLSLKIVMLIYLLTLCSYVVFSISFSKNRMKYNDFFLLAYFNKEKKMFVKHLINNSQEK